MQREERLAQLRSTADRQAREIAHIERFVERFRYKATKARQVQSRIKTLEKLERIEVPDHRTRVARFGFPRRSDRRAWWPSWSTSPSATTASRS